MLEGLREHVGHSRSSIVNDPKDCRECEPLLE